MITIKMYQDEWRISITGEEWKFNSAREALDELETIVLMKDKYGRLKGGKYE